MFLEITDSPTGRHDHRHVMMFTMFLFVCFAHMLVHRKCLRPYTNMQLVVHSSRANWGGGGGRERRREGGRKGGKERGSR